MCSSLYSYNTKKWSHFHEIPGILDKCHFLSLQCPRVSPKEIMRSGTAGQVIESNAMITVFRNIGKSVTPDSIAKQRILNLLLYRFLDGQKELHIHRFFKRGCAHEYDSMTLRAFRTVDGTLCRRHCRKRLAFRWVTKSLTISKEVCLLSRKRHKSSGKDLYQIRPSHLYRFNRLL